ncbi:MAG TPA: medium chain dehydrogenase/reductase family protein [Gemmatimonadales bacterium]|nr:medium chain dehydrogenase/reductase family protein [Gemmatimonadales bacterium]
MKQVVIPRRGPPEVLDVREVPDPVVQPGTVRIRVHAAGVNFSDLLARQGLYPDAPKTPCTVGYEVAGVADALGSGVTTLRVGDRVIATTQFGGQSELVVVPWAAVFPLPNNWTFEQGAAFPVVYLTAHHMLVRIAAAQPGETVLLHSAAGGVGLAVAELGRILGLRVVGLASPQKHAVLREYGVEPLDSRDPRWFEAARKLHPRGYDVVLDAIGGTSWRQGYRLLAPAGRLICYGAQALSEGEHRNMLKILWRVIRFPRFGPLALMSDNKAVAGVNLGHIWSEQALLAPQMDALLRYAREGKITPRVDRAFPFADAAAAHRYIHERRNVGKVLLVP